MRTTQFLALSIGLLALAACKQSPQENAAENIEANAEMTAENIEANADMTADNIVANADNAAENVTDNAVDNNTVNAY